MPSPLLRSQDLERGKIRSGAAVACLLFSLALGTTAGAPNEVFADSSSSKDLRSRASRAAEQIQLREEPQLLKGDRIVIGTVAAVKGDQIKVEYPDSLQPRYLPLERAKDRGMEISKGDIVRMVFNEQHILVDFHPLGHGVGDHQVVSGRVDQQMKVGQERVVVKRDQGEQVTYQVRPLIRSKVAALPVGVPALFLIDEDNQIVDVTFGDLNALNQVKHQYRQMSNPKSSHTRIDGTIVTAMSDGRITVKTTEGKKQTYQVRPYAAKELTAIKVGQEVTLLIDSDEQVLDVAAVNKSKP